MFVLPSPSKFRGTTDNFVHWSINAIARINILFFFKNSGLLSTNVVALFNYTNKVISNEICLVYLYFNYGYIYNHVFLNNGGTYWYKQPDIWNLLDIYLNPCKSRIRQKWTTTGKPEGNNKTKRHWSEEYKFSIQSLVQQPPRCDDKQQNISKYVTTSVGSIINSVSLKTYWEISKWMN